MVIIPCYRERNGALLLLMDHGQIQGGGSLGSGIPLLGTHKLHEEGKKTKVCALECNTFLVGNSYPDPPFQNPVSAPVDIDYVKLANLSIGICFAYFCNCIIYRELFCIGCTILLIDNIIK